MGAKRPGAKRPGRKRLGGETSEDPFTLQELANLRGTESIIKAEIQHETREVKAMAQAMCRLFTPPQLVTCSMKGATTTMGSPRPSLPAAERNAIIDVIAKTFDKPLVDVEEKMRGCLRRLRLMHKAAIDRNKMSSINKPISAQLRLVRNAMNVPEQLLYEPCSEKTGLNACEKTVKDCRQWGMRNN
ncbi:hypothetical protein DPMN_119541 [Dreissena polymorpha]|uniref:Uncharacterized protein n=1 Tax=Dreissena polymorpha TaxID=45954 RepID=A0A9D4JMS7_DREPO|nr:hypothetical protein DPMN_119541 [Dreissena polymorpha]